EAQGLPAPAGHDGVYPVGDADLDAVERPDEEVDAADDQVDNADDPVGDSGPDGLSRRLNAFPCRHHAVADAIPHRARRLLNVLPGPSNEVPDGLADIFDVAPGRLPITTDDGQHESDHVTDDAYGGLDDDADLAPDAAQDGEDGRAPVL